LANDLLFNGDPAKRTGASKAIEAALNQYRTLSALVATLNDAISLRDDGQVYLPAYSVFLEFDATNLSNWKEAARATFELNDVLNRPAAGSLPQDTRVRMRELVTTLRNSLKKLRQQTETAWTRGPIDERQLVNGADSVKMRALLQLADWSMPERLHLWSNYRKVAARLNAEAVARETASDLPAPDDPVAAVRHERDRALTRAEVSAGLLQLAQAADADRVAVELDRVKRSPTEEPSWDALAAVLRQAWKQYDLDKARSGKD
jgi:hypothetical protein